jgi:hypothetical protein
MVFFIVFLWKLVLVLVPKFRNTIFNPLFPTVYQPKLKKSMEN